MTIGLTKDEIVSILRENIAPGERINSSELISVIADAIVKNNEKLMRDLCNKHCCEND